jgi:acetolactate synthase-1/2/3 large subunit
MKSSDLFVRCLEQEGVQYLFGLPGEENLELLESLRHSSIRFISTRHEQGAAFMADVYGRLTGRAGVCLATLGPGATNLATGVADANLDHAPLVAITAQAGLERIHKESHQFVDILKCFQPLTKWNTRVERASVIPEVVRKAFKLAQAEKPGACHIELPEDAAAIEVNQQPLSTVRPRRPSPDHESLLKAARLIEESVHPIILAGNGAVRGRAGEELLRFSKKTGIPVANTFMGKGIVPAEYDLALLTIGLQSQDYTLCGFDRADLIIVAGYDLVEFSPRHWNPDGKKQIIHIDFTPSEVDAYYQPVVEIVADIRETLEKLGAEVKGQKDITHTKALRSILQKEQEVNAANDGFPVKPQRILHEIRRALGPEDILVSDVGAHKIWIARMFPASRPNTVIISNGFAAMGIGLPGAIAAKLVHPDRKVLAVCGDGGFLMTSAELETASRLGLPIVVLIFNDHGYGLITWKQQKRFGREFGTRLGNPDLAGLAESFGAKGYRVERAADLGPMLSDAFSQKVPSVIDVPVDYSENFRFMENMGAFIMRT